MLLFYYLQGHYRLNFPEFLMHVEEVPAVNAKMGLATGGGTIL